MDLSPGTVLLGKYRVDDQLGIGGMARVIRATHLFLQQPIAIKVLLPEMVESDSTVARFLREAQATVRLRSEHIARVQDVGTFEDGTPYMVMEYLDGNDLNQILRHHGPQAPSIVCDLMLQACEGIAEAHAYGIIHRDIKPSNFFLTRRPDGSMLLKILDFGISKAPVGYDDLTGTQTVIGTPTYMAPEQMKSGKSADPRSDIWSLGVVMYQLLSGRPPFSGESYAELILKVGGEAPSPMHVALPNGLGEIILRCLEKQPSARFHDAAELARFIAPFASDPANGAQAAARASRILMGARNSRHQIPVGGFNGNIGADLATPVPLSPSALTPHHHSQGSSLNQGRGQVTVAVGSNRGWLVAGALTLVIIAGAGGFIASRVLGSESAVAAAPPAPPTAPLAPPVTPTAPTAPPAPAVVAPTPPPNEPAVAAVPPTGSNALPAPQPTFAKPDETKPDATKDTTKDATKDTKPAVSKAEPKPATKVEAKPATKVEVKPATKPVVTRTEKPTTKATTKPTTKPTTKKPTTTKKPKDDDLFDSRK